MLNKWAWLYSGIIYVICVCVCPVIFAEGIVSIPVWFGGFGFFLKSGVDNKAAQYSEQWAQHAVLFIFL